MDVAIRPIDDASILNLIESTWPEACDDEDEDEQGDYVCIGDVIPTDEDGFLRGHGTQVVHDSDERRDKLVATLCGVVQRVDRLVYVRPLKSRYSAEVGDVVVGRISEVAPKRWKVDLNARQEAGLLISAVNLPGGIQRRRTAEDELNMRSVFAEGDLISAEVQSVHGDGSIALHTRSAKYGKLGGGQLVVVPPNLVKRQKQHFHVLPAAGVDLVLGINGLLWVAPHVGPLPETEQQREALDAAPPAHVTAAQRGAATRVAAAVRALARLYLTISPATIMDAYSISLDQGTSIRDMAEESFLQQVLSSESVRRDTARMME